MYAFLVESDIVYSDFDSGRGDHSLENMAELQSRSAASLTNGSV